MITETVQIRIEVDEVDGQLVARRHAARRADLAAYLHVPPRAAAHSGEPQIPRTDQCPPPAARFDECLIYDEQFRTLEANARRENVPMEDVQAAKYALAAFIDETVLTSSWAAKDAWAGQPLQLEYFNDFSAGEEFYNKVDAIRAGGNPRKAEILEVYYACLALGFKGKYVDLQGMEKKKLLMDSLAREIQSLRPGSTGGLSPRPEPPDQMPALVQAMPAWVIAASCGVLVLFLFLLLSLLLGWSAGGVHEAVN